jgi:hypothetical protein
MPDQPFIIDACGEFPPGAVRVEWNAPAGPSNPAVEELKSAWWAHVAEVTGRGGVLFNGPMVRYLSHTLDDGQLVIRAEPTDFTTFYCTNYLNHGLGERIGWQHFANPIGISANVITSDGCLVYGRRSQRVACHPGAVHAVGGALEPTDRNAAGELDVFASMERELREELNLAQHESVNLLCLGLIRDPQIRQPELVFDATLALTRDDLARRIGPDDEEHDGLVAVRDEPAALKSFLRTTPSAVPILIAALCLHARRAFGSAVC